MTYDQAEALNDGTVTDDEMAAAIAAAEACLADRGIDALARPNDETTGFRSGWTFEVAEMGGGMDAIAVCSDAAYGQMDLGYLLAGQQLTDASARSEAIRQCLTGRGVDIGDRLLSEVLTDVPSEHLAACAPAPSSKATP